jgi:hydroxymethylbilane synthase
MWQAYHVEHALRNAGMYTDVVPIETKGDMILDVTMSKIGTKGVFTEELEQMLLTGEIDLAVHSAKDLPSELPGHFEILAFTKREKPHDVLVSHKSDIHLNEESTMVIGTSSTRRVATLRHYFPGIRIVDIRGNLQTRIGKMEGGLCDAIVLAYAGVHRMNYHHYIREHLDEDVFTPPVGQGSLAVEISKNMEPELRQNIRDALNDDETEACLRCERSFLRTLHGGCSTPAFALTRRQDDRLMIKAGLFSPDGQQLITRQLEGNDDDPEGLGREVGEYVLNKGGREILDNMNRSGDIG